MSITTRARTRPRAEAMVRHLAAHPDFAELIEADLLAISYKTNAKGTLDTDLLERVAKLRGFMVTVTPVGGKNSGKGQAKVANETRFAVNIWTWPVLEDARLPDPHDFRDELQRVLEGFNPPHESGTARNANESAVVGDWVEVVDPTYLNHEIQVTALVPLGKAEN